MIRKTIGIVMMFVGAVLVVVSIKEETLSRTGEFCVGCTLIGYGLLVATEYVW